MEAILEENLSSAEIQVFEKAYHNERNQNGTVSSKTQFEYSWALIRSRYTPDIKRGIQLLENLLEYGDNKRDYLYYLIISYFKIGQYQRALDHCDAFLDVEKNNRQVIELKKVIKDKLIKEGLKGAAVTGGILVGAVAGIVGLTMALSKK